LLKKKGVLAGTGLGGDAPPDALGCFDEHAGADQPFYDPGCRLGRELEGVTQSLYRDERRAPVNDFFKDRSDDLRTTGRVSAIQIHKASLPSRVW
jgi:hypothetical protein